MSLTFDAMEFVTGKSFSEALILASINHNMLFIELQVQ